MKKYTLAEQRRNREKLVKALRSGKYRQCTNYLKQVDKEGPRYCCLGVACEISKLGEYDERDEDCQEYRVSRFQEGEVSYLPSSVMEYYGFNSDTGAASRCLIPRSKHNLTSLTQVNDYGYKFDRIASIIESEPEGMFEKEEDR